MSIWYESVFAKSEKKADALVVDFDGTIARDAYPGIGDPMPGAKEALTQFLDAGYEVVIFSARLRRNDGRPASEVENQREKMIDWFEEHQIPYSRIDDGYDGKPHANFYIDNKALHYGGDDDWESISKFILSKGK